MFLYLDPVFFPGTLSIMVGGKEEHLDICRPVFEAMGSRVEHMGAAGAGAATKLVNQVWLPPL